MKTAVFIKQVPDTQNVARTPDNNIDRANTDCIMNPSDREALEAALILKEKYSSEVIAVSMGPKNAYSVLKEAIAAGADDAILLCDPKFAGSDTCATSAILSKAIKEKLSDVDLFLFGQSAIDGETAQTGPSVAAKLDLPFITHVNNIIQIEDNTVTVNKETSEESSVYKVILPAVLCINNYAVKPRNLLIKGYMRASDFEYKEYNLYEISMNPEKSGIKGSPTYVRNVYVMSDERNCKYIYPEKTPGYADIVIKEMTEA